MAHMASQLAEITLGNHIGIMITHCSRRDAEITLGNHTELGSHNVVVWMRKSHWEITLKLGSHNVVVDMLKSH